MLPQPLQVLGLVLAVMLTGAGVAVRLRPARPRRPAALVTDETGVGRALRRSLRLASGNGLRAVWIRVLGYLAWLLIRIGLALGTIAIVELFFTSPLDHGGQPAHGRGVGVRERPRLPDAGLPRRRAAPRGPDAHARASTSLCAAPSGVASPPTRRWRLPDHDPGLDRGVRQPARPDPAAAAGRCLRGGDGHRRHAAGTSGPPGCRGTGPASGPIQSRRPAGAEWPRTRLRLGRLRWRWRRRRRRARMPPRRAELAPDELPDLPAAVLALTADQLAAAGRYAEAVRERLRAMVAELIESGLIPASPGWTVTELAAAGRRAPAGAASAAERRGRASSPRSGTACARRSRATTPRCASTPRASASRSSRRSGPAASPPASDHDRHGQPCGAARRGRAATRPGRRRPARPAPAAAGTGWRSRSSCSGCSGARPCLAHHLKQPNAADPGTLSPTGTGPDGSSQLAQLLVDKGIVIQRVTTTAEAVQAARLTSATVFVPFPDFAQPDLPNQLINSGVRVVIVKPGLRGLTNLPVVLRRPAGRRPSGTPAAHSSTRPDRPRSAAMPIRLDVQPQRLLLRRQPRRASAPTAPSTSCVGATDPFRNSYLDEVGNAALRHRAARHPSNRHLAGRARQGTGRAQSDRLPEAEPAGVPARRPGPYRRGSVAVRRRSRRRCGRWSHSPWRVAVLLAFARGRRLGGPVPEPLPVLVPAAEAVTGRGRLYDRISARAATLNTLRAAAIRRLQAVVNPFAPRSAIPDPATLVAQLAARTGAPSAAISETLYGPAPSVTRGWPRPSPRWTRSSAMPCVTPARRRALPPGRRRRPIHQPLRPLSRHNRKEEPRDRDRGQRRPASDRRARSRRRPARRSAGSAPRSARSSWVRTRP